MALNESTPVTVHQHTGGTSTFSNYPYGVTLSADQTADEILGTAVLSNGAKVVVTATVGLVALPPGYIATDTAAYTSVQVTTIDNGVATTNTLSFAAGADFLDRAYTSENLQVLGLSNGGYVIAETTVDDNIGPVNKNLYVEVFSNSGSVVTPWEQVNQTGSDASQNDDYQLRATAGAASSYNLQLTTRRTAISSVSTPAGRRPIARSILTIPAPTPYSAEALRSIRPAMSRFLFRILPDLTTSPARSRSTVPAMHS